MHVGGSYRSLPHPMTTTRGVAALIMPPGFLQRPRVEPSCQPRYHRRWMVMLNLIVTVMVIVAVVMRARMVGGQRVPQRKRLNGKVDAG